MKKLLILLAFGISGLTLASCNDSKDEKKENDKVLSAGDVPAAVTTAFTNKYSSAADVTWEDAKEGDKKTYKAKFTVDGKKMKAEFDEAGAFVKEEEDD